GTNTRPFLLPDPALASCGSFLPTATPTATPRSYSTLRPSAAAPAPRESVACSTPTDTLPARSVGPPGCSSGTAAPADSATRARCPPRPPTVLAVLPNQPCPPAASAAGFSDRAGSRSAPPPAACAAHPALLPL